MNWSDFKIAEKAGFVVSKKTVDNIQTTSRATLSTAGWYRVAEYSGINTGSLRGGTHPHVCELLIKRRYDAKANETHSIRFSMLISNFTFETLGSYSRYQLFKKIRYTYNENELKGYIEVYYAESVSNTCQFEILFGSNAENTFKAITPTLTSETVDGVTVTTTYDIPANASPVTNLDIAEAVNTINLGMFTMLESDLDAFAKDNGIGDRWTYIATINPKTSSDGVYVFGGAPWTLIGMEYANNQHGFQIGFSGRYTKTRRLVSGVWNDWQTLATNADLANYLPKNGGTLTGDLYIKKSNYPSEARIINYNGEAFFRNFVDDNNYTEVILASDKNLKYRSKTSSGTTTSTVLHTGNSAKVVIQESAPSDTTALWVY